MWESYHPSHVLAQGIPDKYRVGTVLDFEDFYQWGGKFYDTIKKKVETTMPKQNRRWEPIMMVKVLFILALYFISLWLYMTRCTWWSALFYGLICSQVGVNIMHDGNHYAFTNNIFITWLVGHALDLMGSSSQVYRRSHNFGHHSCVNHFELDRSFDTTFPYMRLHQNQPRKWFHAYQHLYALPLYTMVNFGDLFGTFDEFFSMSNYPNRRAHAPFSSFLCHCLTKFCWLWWAILIPSYLHGYENIFPVWFLYMTSFSVGYSLFFAVNHWCTEAGFSDNSDVGDQNWGVLQVTNSVNFALDSPFWTHLTGGLNHQIEHHLFPSLIHTRLTEVQPIVKETCKEFGIHYFQYPSFWSAMRAHFRLLKGMGAHDKLQDFAHLKLD